MVAIRIILITSILSCIGVCLLSQEYSFGVRAGQNYSTNLGPSDPGEDFGITGGFHFGINMYYNFTDDFSLRTEILYTQSGTDHTYSGESNYLIYTNPNATEFSIVKGNLERNIDISNAYLQIPVTAHYRINRRWEVYGGVYGGILLSPTGRGTALFESISDNNDILFQQSLDHGYYNDDLGQQAVVAPGRNLITVLVDGQDVVIPKVVNAYYSYQEKDGNLYNTFDAGLSAGFAYYFNRGFYMGLKIDYGLFDTTNNRMDRSLSQISDTNDFILSSDTDRNLSTQISFGFKF